MDLSPIKSAEHVAKVMNKLDPLSKNQVLFLQALEHNGMKNLVDQYFKTEFPEEFEE
jgi:hypothetical protein